MIKAIIFDFDGLIVDTESVWYEAYRDVLLEYELELSLEKFSEVIGTHDAVLHSYIQENLKTPVDSELIEKSAHDLFHKKMGQPTLREHVEEYLIAAKESGLKIGLASSSSREWVEGYLKKLNIIQYFDVIKTRDDVRNVKPDPELYLKAIEALKIQSSDAIAFEDSLNGLKAARKAGLKCVVIPNSVTSNLPFEDFSIRLSSMKDMTLKDLLLNI